MAIMSINVIIFSVNYRRKLAEADQYRDWWAVKAKMMMQSIERIIRIIRMECME